MDQIKIGRFISAQRKEKGYTQAALAEKLGITDRAVSKWETGKSLPDSSIMLELCDILSISANELLKGEKIAMEDLKNVSESLVMELKIKSEENARMLLKLEIVLGIVNVIALGGFFFGGAILLDETDNHVLGYVMIVLGVIILFIFAFVGIWIEQKAGYYCCAECGHRHQPSYRQVLIAPHYGRTRKMRCPECGKLSYQKKCISEPKEE